MVAARRKDSGGGRRASVVLSCLAIVATMAACLRSEEDSQRALDEALGRALQPRKAGALSLWPEGHLEVRGHFSLSLGEERWKLEVRRDSWVRSDGSMHVIDERHWTSNEMPGTPEALIEDKRDRFEGIFDGHVWVTRSGYGPWIERDTSDGHHIRTQIRVRDWLPTLVRAFGGRIGTVPTADAVGVFGGRPGAWHRLVLQPRTQGASGDAEAIRALKDNEHTWSAWVDATHVPESVSGRIAVAADSRDEVLVGDLSVAGATEVRGMPGRFEAEAHHVLAPLEEGASFALPETWYPEKRERVWPMIREVLGDALSETWGGAAAPTPAP